MTSSPFRRNAFYVGPVALMIVTGLLLGTLVGCDENVQSTVWIGLNDLAVALVDALFTALDPAASNVTPVTVSWLDAVQVSFCA